MRARPIAIEAGITAVVTGACGGLGRAICTRLEALGATVVRTDAPGIAGADRSLDVTDPGACRSLANETRAQVWVNNAGVLGDGVALTQGDDEVRRLVEINLLGVINGTRAAGTVMTAEGRGAILNIGSLAAWNPTPGLAVYSATKHAVRAYSSAVAAEVRSQGVRVTCLCPDGIWTPMLKAAVSSGTAAMPFSSGRLLEPEEVAAVAIRLIQGHRLVASLPPGRAVLAKVSGLWPATGVLTRSLTQRRGLRTQARYRRLLDDHPPQVPEHEAAP